MTLLTLAALATKSVLLLALGLLAALLASRAPAAARHRLWSAILLGLLLLPLAQQVLPRWPLPWLPARPGVALAPAADTAPSTHPVAAPEPHPRRIAPLQPHRFPPPMPAPALWLLTLWLGGTWVMLVRLAANTRRLHRLVRAADGAPIASAEAARLAPLLGLRHRYTVRAAAAVRVPQACGLFRRVVLVPAGFDEWSPRRRRLVLAHELAHLRRADPFWLWISRLAEAAYWWNPLIRPACRCLRLASEQACDEAAVAIAASDGLKPADYAAELLAVARSLLDASPPFSIAAAMTRGAVLDSRIRAILDRGPSHRAHAAIGVCAVVLACAGLLPLAAARLSAPAQTPASTPAFDAASIKPLGSTAGVHIHSNRDPTHLNFSGSLHDFIVQAYGIRNGSQLIGEPGWFRSELFLISAVSGRPADQAQQMLMLRTLLADRFHLQLRTESRTFATYNLVIAGGGPKFKAVPPDAPEPKDPEETPAMFGRAFESVPELVTVLNNIYGGRIHLDRPVVDMTGLTGRYDFVFTTEVDVGDSGSGQRAVSTPNLMNDLTAELGLRLVPGHAAFPCYIVIGASRPTPN